MSSSLAKDFLINIFHNRLKNKNEHSPDGRNANNDISLLNSEGVDDLPWSKGLNNRRSNQKPWRWIASTIFFAVLALILFIRTGQTSDDSFQTGFLTELKSARNALRLKRIQFSGSLNFDANGTLMREHTSGEAIWVGKPTPEMDALWDHYESAIRVYLEGIEADDVRDKTRLQHGYWDTGLDVFHQLHCLNTVRKALYPEYYPIEETPRVHKLHIDHCIDYIRQGISCAASIVPINIVWSQLARRSVPDFDTYHTCRDIDLLLNWSLARGKTRVEGKEGKEIGESAIQGDVLMDDPIYDS